jgi:hypothetical protein
MELFEGYREVEEGDVGDAIAYSKEELTRFQQMAFYDVFIGQLDRHNDNLFVGEGNSELTTLRCIDNANSFPIKGANSVNGHNMFKWTEYEVAEKPFTEDALSFLKTLDTEKVDTTIKYINSVYKKYVSVDMTNFIHLRLKLLKSLQHENSTIKCPRDFAQFKNRTAINEYLAPLTEEK